MQRATKSAVQGSSNVSMRCVAKREEIDSLRVIGSEVLGKTRDHSVMGRSVARR
ncbi:MAG: hypothetical protein H6728_06730 [Myxococcales bacterium]|nr:hypothetical protein [Myxococcales bacterium]